MKIRNLLLQFVFIIIFQSVNSQVTHVLNNSTGADFLGYNGTGTTSQLEIRNDFNPSKPIDFYINNQYFLSIIAGNSNPREGDLCVIQPTNGYEIGNWRAGTPTNHLVLWHNGNTKNIFVGVNSGSGNASDENTFIGNGTGTNTGLSGQSGAPDYYAGHNTFVGHVAGNLNDQGNKNVFVGDSCGYSNVDGFHNSFLGVDAGRC